MFICLFWASKDVFYCGGEVEEPCFEKITKFKGTMLPGFCSFFVITVLIVQLVTLFHAQNVAFNAKGRYQVNFRIDTKLLLVLSDFSKTQRYNLQKLAQLFQIVIHFHPGHPQLKHLLIVWIPQTKLDYYFDAYKIFGLSRSS